MAIHFDKDLNAQLRKEVRNFNRRRDRLERAGYKNIPRRQYVSELKARYSVRSDLTREIERLKNFSRGDLERKIETDGGVKAVEWEFDYVKSNRKAAKEYFEREYERVSKRIGKFPGERTYLDTISAKIDLMSKDIRYMNQSEFRSAVTAVNEFAKSPSQIKAEYRGFLSEVDWVMTNLGYSKEKRDEFFKKFEKLTPSQFIYAYDNNDIIGRIYSLYHKDYGDDEGRLTTSEEDAETLMDTLMEEADDIVLDAQMNMD